MEQECVFCVRKFFEERLIAEDENFYFIATLGQIEEGYTLLVPRQHKICLGDLTEAEMGDLVAALSRIKNAISEEYKPPILFEHGDVGQTVKHAHLHLVPAEVNLLPPMRKDLRLWTSIASLQQLRAIRETCGKYLFYADQAGKMYVFPVYLEEIPPQYLRTVLANALARPERANWRTMDPELDRELWTRTRDRIRAKLYPRQS